MTTDHDRYVQTSQKHLKKDTINAINTINTIICTLFDNNRTDNSFITSECMMFMMTDLKSNVR